MELENGNIVSAKGRVLALEFKNLKPRQNHKSISTNASKTPNLKATLTIVIPLLEPLVPNGLRDINGPPGGIRPLPEPPQPELELLHEIPELIIALLPRLYRLPWHRPSVQPGHVRYRPPVIPILPTVRVTVLHKLLLVDLIGDLLGPPHELDKRVGPEVVPPFFVGGNLLGGGIRSGLEEGVLVEDPLDLRSVTVVREVLAFPEVAVDPSRVVERRRGW